MSEEGFELLDSEHSSVAVIFNDAIRVAEVIAQTGAWSLYHCIQSPDSA